MFIYAIYFSYYIKTLKVFVNMISLIGFSSSTPMSTLLLSSSFHWAISNLQCPPPRETCPSPFLYVSAFMHWFPFGYPMGSIIYSINVFERGQGEIRHRLPPRTDNRSSGCFIANWSPRNGRGLKVPAFVEMPHHRACFEGHWLLFGVVRRFGKTRYFFVLHQLKRCLFCKKIYISLLMENIWL